MYRLYILPADPLREAQHPRHDDFHIEFDAERRCGVLGVQPRKKPLAWPVRRLCGPDYEGLPGLPSGDR